MKISKLRLRRLIMILIPENIVPGIYYVTFKTSGYEYKIDTTDYAEVDSVVGLDFKPEDLHIMSKTGSY